MNRYLYPLFPFGVHPAYLFFNQKNLKTFDCSSSSFFFFLLFSVWMILCVKVAWILMLVMTVGVICKWNPTSCVRVQSDSLRWTLCGSFSSGLSVVEPPYLSFSNRLFKGLPTCYPRLPVDSDLLTRVGVGSNKSSNLVWQSLTQPCPCLSVTVLCNPRWGQRHVWGWGSCQIMVGQLYMLVVFGLHL